MSKLNTQTGFSILSLLIASLIGLFVIGGVAKIYIDSKNAFNTRSAIAATTEKYRFAFVEMRRSLVMAGRGISASDDSPEVYSEGQGDSGARTFPTVDCNLRNDCIESGSALTGEAWTPDPQDSSTVSVRYTSGPSPCGVDESRLDGTTMTVRFRVDEEGELHCEAYQGGVQILSHPIISGVVQMRVLYGVDTDLTPDEIANYYVTADQVKSHEWMNVVSIRIGLVVSSGTGLELPKPHRPQSPSQLNLLGATFTAPDTRYLYKSVNTTISLRNLHHMDRQATDS
jgi:type IV pilus assembly protein PilW